MTEGLDLAFEKIDPQSEADQIEGLQSWRKTRDQGAVTKALDELKRVAATSDNLFPASIEAAKAGVTTGEWSDALRDAFGEFLAVAIARVGFGEHDNAGQCARYSRFPPASAGSSGSRRRRW